MKEWILFLGLLLWYRRRKREYIARHRPRVQRRYDGNGRHRGVKPTPLAQQIMVFKSRPGPVDVRPVQQVELAA